MPQVPEWTKPAAWAAVGGAVVITVIGFTADWVTMTGSANAMAEDRAEEAVISALTPICVAQFMAEPATVREDQLVAMQELDRWDHGDIVTEQGWATMPGAEEPLDDVAEGCAEHILDAAEADA